MERRVYIVVSRQVIGAAYSSLEALLEAHPDKALVLTSDGTLRLERGGAGDNKWFDVYVRDMMPATGTLRLPFDSRAST